MKRILCVWLPRWPIQRWRRGQAAPDNLPVVLYGPRSGTGTRSVPATFSPLVVSACSGSAVRQGVRPGMPLAEARALLADGHFTAHERRADREALRKLACWCERFSPVVAVEEAAEPESVVLDVTGCGPVHGGEEAQAAKAVAELGRRGYEARAGLADTLGTAWAVAHHEARRSSPAVVVAPGKQEAALRRLPVEALRLSGKVLQLLRGFDIRRVEQVLALPRADLPARFGGEIGQRLDQALGSVPELLTPEPVAEPVEAAWTFEPPTGDRRVLEKVFEHLLEKVLERLRPRQRGIQRMVGLLRMVGGETAAIRVGLLQASGSAQHLMGLVRLHCERLRLPEEVAELVVRAAAVAPLAFTQEELFASGMEAAGRRQLPALIERLSSRLGEKAVLRARLWPDAQPEHACRFEPWLASDVSTLAFPLHSRAGMPRKKASGGCQPAGYEMRLRPACLRSRPVPVPVTALFPGGPPLRFAWQGQGHVVAHAWGPERIETGWWRGADVQRDYYLVETTTGRRFWLFRTREEERWFLHGTFA